MLATIFNINTTVGQSDTQGNGIRLKTEVPILVSSPYLCPIVPGSKRCNKLVSLAWETPRLGNYCLWDATNQKKISCWEQQWSGIIEIRFQSSHSITYQLINKDNTKKLAEVKVIVLEKLNQNIKRKRPFWKIF